MMQYMLQPCFPILVLTLLFLLLPGYGIGAEKNQIDAGELRYLDPYDFPNDPLTTEWKKIVAPEGRLMFFKDKFTGMEFLLVKGGCFQMGSPSGEDGRNRDEGPIHEVCVDDFYMGKYEVTQGEWRKVMLNTPSRFKEGGRYPLKNVSWNDVQEYIRALNELTGRNYRLPTEAEWEYAARSGGKREKYAGSNSMDDVAWHLDNSGWTIHRVGTKKPNGLGLYDMSGNVYEWCQDWYGWDYYSSSPRQNPTGPASGKDRVYRGGAWHGNSWDLRAANRFSISPGSTGYAYGFRLVSPVH